MPVASILKCLLFGFTIAIAIGPIALLIVNYGVTRGFRAAARSALGAGLADLTYAILAFVAGDLLVTRLEAHRSQFAMVAALLLMAFGGYMLLGALRARSAVRSSGSPPRGNEFATTYALTLLNPLTVVVFAGFAGQLPLAGSTTLAIVLAFSVFIGSVAVQLTLAAAGAQLGRWLGKPATLRVLNFVGGLGILAFGLAGLWPHVGPH